VLARSLFRFSQRFVPKKANPVFIGGIWSKEGFSIIQSAVNVKQVNEI